MANKEIIELVNDMLEQEESMLKIYEKIISETGDEEILKVLRPIAADEGRHIGNAMKIMEILKD